MFGYATQETDELMPLSLVLAHKLNKKMADCRRDGSMPWLRPDSKTQVCLKLVFLIKHVLYCFFMVVLNSLGDSAIPQT